VRLRGHTCPAPAQGGVSGINLTGWTALAGVMAMAALFMGAAVYGYRHYTGQDRQGYTLVQKSEPRQPEAHQQAPSNQAHNQEAE